MKKLYRYVVEEVTRKVIEVEAENEQEAEDIALETVDMEKEPDYYIREANLLEVNDVSKHPKVVKVEMTNPDYDNTILEWYFDGDDESMTYWRMKWVRTGNKLNMVYSAVCLFHAYDDLDGWIPMMANGKTYSDAIEMLDIMPFNLADGMERQEAEEFLLNWMKNN